MKVEDSTASQLKGDIAMLSEQIDRTIDVVQGICTALDLLKQRQDILAAQINMLVEAMLGRPFNGTL